MKKIFVVLLCVCLFVCAVSCSAPAAPSAGTSGVVTKAPATTTPQPSSSAKATPKLPDFINEAPSAEPTMEPAPEPTADPTTELTPEPTVREADPQTETVYWVPKGKVWHTTPDCSTLSRSKTIMSGSIEESGKPRVCKKCG